jgi:signal transduction histidine kinase
MTARFKNFRDAIAGFFKAGSRLLIQPKSKSEDSRRREFILNVILLGSLAVLLVFDGLVLYESLLAGTGYKGMAFGAFSLVVLIVAVLYLLSRLGYFKFSAYIFVGALFLLISYSAYRWGTDLPAVLMGYAMVIIISGILISINFGFWLTCGAVMVVVGLGFAEIHGGVLPDRYWKLQVLGADNIIEYALMLLFLTVVSWLSNREMENSLARARRSERELKLERDHLEQTVEERTRELRETQYRQLSQHAQFVELGRLAGGYVHDLANPLSVLSLSIGALSGAGPGSASEALAAAINSCDRMEKLLEALRAKIRHDETREWFFPAKELKDAVSLLRHKAAGREVEIVPKPCNPNIRLFGNSSGFHQVVSNLIANAIEAYPQISATHGQFGRIVEISLHQTGQTVILTVVDHGGGIAEGDVQKIFDPLFTSKIGTGLGMGLFTVRRIVERDFGGAVSVSGRAGQGTVFTVSVPVPEALNAGFLPKDSSGS